MSEEDLLLRLGAHEARWQPWMLIADEDDCRGAMAATLGRIVADVYPSSRPMTSGQANPGRTLEAVLFDMDGTVVDTEPYWIAAEYELVREFGGTWNDEHAHNLVGNELLVSARYLRDVGGVDLDPPLIVERLLDAVVVAARTRMPWRPGARELLAECVTAGVPCALVTMSYTRLTDALIEQLPPGTFTTVVTGDQVSAGKPDPEAYRTACARLGVQPGASVAIEDSPTGLASAEAAGCVVVGVPHHVPIPDTPGRTLVDSLELLSLARLDTLAARGVRA